MGQVKAIAGWQICPHLAARNFPSPTQLYYFVSSILFPQPLTTTMDGIPPASYFRFSDLPEEIHLMVYDYLPERALGHYSRTTILSAPTRAALRCMYNTLSTTSPRLPKLDHSRIAPQPHAKTKAYCLPDLRSSCQARRLKIFRVTENGTTH